MFPDIQKEQPVFTKFWQKVYLLDNLKSNLLISINIMGSELVIVNMGRKRVILESCNIEVPIEIKFCSQSAHKITCLIYAQKITVVPSHLALPICIHYINQILIDCNYLFELRDVNFSIYTHIVNS